MTLASPLDAAITELQAAGPVTAITTRIRPIEPGSGDALGPGKYIPFVVVSVLDATPLPRAGIRDVTLGLRCYGATFPAAETLWLACEEVFRDRGARMSASRLGIYHSVVVSGGMPDKDPDTHQPLYHGVVSYPTTVSAVPA